MAAELINKYTVEEYQLRDGDKTATVRIVYNEGRSGFSYYFVEKKSGVIAPKPEGVVFLALYGSPMIPFGELAPGQDYDFKSHFPQNGIIMKWNETFQLEIKMAPPRLELCTNVNTVSWFHKLITSMR